MDTRIPSLDKLNQPDFIARLQAGDETAYQNVMEELATWFAVYIKRKFGITEEDAKDLVQDVIMNVYRKIKRFEPAKGKFTQWAFSILRNQCLDWLRKRKRERLTFRELLAADLSIQDEAKIFRDDLSPLEKLPREVRAAILRLPGRYQQFVGLMLLGASEDYTMGIMQIKTHSAFRSLKSRVLSKLRMEIQQLK
ncbi:RNA polymerase sigma factor [candidate division KSB1 bacterium]|nr:RNA polymerase sigma factor [candidate division KSB1 bacterium]